MNFQKKLPFLLIILSAVLNNVFGICEIRLNALGTSRAKEPLFLSAENQHNDINFIFKPPRNGLLTFQNSEVLYLSCPKSSKHHNHNFKGIKLKFF